jgi:hypothetical protein
VPCAGFWTNALLRKLPPVRQALLMLEGVMDYSHSRSVYRLHPGDSQV